MNINAVRGSFKQFIFEYNATDVIVSDVTKDLARMLRLRYKSDAPRRPPRVILLGPPGSSRSTQSKILADSFGMVNVSPIELLKVEAERNPGVKLRVRDAIEKGSKLRLKFNQQLTQSSCLMGNSTTHSCRLLLSLKRLSSIACIVYARFALNLLFNE